MIANAFNLYPGLIYLPSLTEISVNQTQRLVVVSLSMDRLRTFSPQKWFDSALFTAEGDKTARSGGHVPGVSAAPHPTDFNTNPLALTLPVSYVVLHIDFVDWGGCFGPGCHSGAQSISLARIAQRCRKRRVG